MLRLQRTHSQPDKGLPAAPRGEFTGCVNWQGSGAAAPIRVDSSHSWTDSLRSFRSLCSISSLSTLGLFDWRSAPPSLAQRHDERPPSWPSCPSWFSPAPRPPKRPGVSRAPSVPIRAIRGQRRSFRRDLRSLPPTFHVRHAHFWTLRSNLSTFDAISARFSTCATRTFGRCAATFRRDLRSLPPTFDAIFDRFSTCATRTFRRCAATFRRDLRSL